MFLREAFGARSAFVYGWMTLLVVDPGVTAALGIGLAQYLSAALDAPSRLVPAIAVTSIALLGVLAYMGINASARVMTWTAGAKLAIVAVLVGAALARPATRAVPIDLASPPSVQALASSLIAAFFAFGGWWELGRMAEDVSSPRRTMPRALLGGIALVTTIYALASIAYTIAGTGPFPGSDEAFVAAIGVHLFGAAGGRLLAVMVVVAVSGSLAATLIGSPRLYVAMARDGLFPERLARIDTRRGSVPASTLVQVALASLLVVLGTFNEILGYFVPCAVFFLGLSASAILFLPRGRNEREVFTTPLHPMPILLFLVLVFVLLALFAVGQTKQTLLGALVVTAGVVVSRFVVPRSIRTPS